MNTKTFAVLEVGKMYEIVHDPYVRGPTLTLFKNTISERAQSKFVPVWSGFILALETEISPNYGAWVLYEEERLWLPGESFSYLKRVET